MTTLLYMQTDGNPFLLIELLKSLSREGILKFDSGGQKWSWDVNSIKENGTTPNVIEFYVQQISALDEESRRILQYAALLGERFKSADLLLPFLQHRHGILSSFLV